MDTLRTVVYVLGIWTVVQSVVNAASTALTRKPSEEEQLLELLFDGYNPSARPVINSSDTANVAMQFSLLQIQELDLRSQVFTTTGLLILDWRDERLTWDPSEIPLNDIVIEANKLWRPEFASINGADGIYGEYGQFRATVDSNGAVHWEPGGVFKTVCEIDITYYPFDEQICRMIFGAWSYHTTKMNLSSPATAVNLDSYEPNGEWDVHHTNVKRNEFNFDCCPNERFSNIEFTVYLRRRYTFYVMNVILPSLMTSVLLLSIFFCTPAQKVQIGVVVLLSFRIFLLNVTDSIPKTSDHIPLLGIYLTCTMAITTLSMVLTVLVLNLHHVSDRPVPRWVKRFVLVYMARLVCMSIYTSDHNDESSEDESAQNERYGINSDNFGKTISDQLGILTSLNEKKTNGTSNQNPSTSHGVKFSKKSYAYSPAKDSEKEDSKKKEDEYAKEWRKVAEVVDRMFFWLFLIAIVVTTLLLFHPLTNTRKPVDGSEVK